MIDPILICKIVTFTAMLMLGQTWSNMIKEHSSNSNDLKNPF